MDNRIRELRLAKNWSMRELAEKVGAHFTTIAKLEKGERALTLDWSIKIAAALGVDPSEVAGHELNIPNRLDVRMVPIVGSIAAGNWKEAIEAPTGHLPVVGGGPNCFALIPDGTSMDRTLRPGAYIVVDPDQVALLDGKIYAVMNTEGETTVKRFRSDPARLLPESSDDTHRPILLGTDPIQVIGRVTLEVNPNP